MPMPIEESLSQTNLEVLSNFLIKFREAKQEQNLSNYAIKYSNAINGNTNLINFYFSNEYIESGDYYELHNIWLCKFALNETQGIAITWNNFDYQTIISNCEQGGSLSLIKNREQATTSGKRTASNLYQDNYLDYLHYNTLEVQPSPSPSEEPEEPSEEGTIESTTLLILISAILMLIVMYKYIKGLFDK